MVGAPGTGSDDDGGAFWAGNNTERIQYGGAFRGGATLPRTGTSCQGFHNAGVPTFKPTMATHDSDGDDGNDDENDDEDDDDDDSDDDVSTNL